MNIICIDDNEGDLFIIKHQIKKHFPQAIIQTYRFLNDFIQTNAPYDFVITDLGLPDAYGPDVIERIRKVTGKPIIVLSGVGGNDLPLNITRAIHNAGATVFLSKHKDGIKKLPDVIREFN